MKFSIEWHKKCLKEREKSVEEIISKINALKSRLQIDISENLFLTYQIEQAELKNKDGFDQDKFLKKRAKK